MPPDYIKPKDNKLISDMLELIKRDFPDASRLVISFSTEGGIYTLVDAPCILCAIDDAKDNAVRNGAKHKVSDNVKDVIEKFIDTILEPSSNPSESDKAEKLELLERFKSRVKH